MNIEALKTTVAATAPALAAMLSGSVGSIALANLGKAVVGDDQAGPDAIDTAITNGGDEARAKVREAEAQTFKDLADAVGGLEQAKIDAGSAAKRLDALTTLEEDTARERQAARERQKEAKDWWINPVLALAVTGGFFSVLWFVLGHQATSTATNAVAQTLLGVLGTAWVSIITFYFGSSVGSKEKTKLLANQLEEPAA
jgi:hypothetical protein